MTFRLVSLCVLSVLVPFGATAQKVDTAYVRTLDSITVKSKRYTSSLRRSMDGGMSVDMRLMEYMPKILGVADPVHYAQTLPGVQTNGEFRSGLNIQGCDNSHNMLSLNGVPIYNVTHLLGFFSTFNASHYQSMNLSKSTASASAANRIGGSLDMRSCSTRADSMSGEFSVGLISSQGTLRLPIGSKTSLTASLRASYVNLLYSGWLKTDGQQLNYSFYDANVTLDHWVDDDNLIRLDYYSGRDRARFEESEHLPAEVKGNWGNYMGAVHWRSRLADALSMTHSAYVTSYSSRAYMDMFNWDVRGNSSITDIGYKGEVEWMRLRCGVEAVRHRITPMSIKTEGAATATDMRRNGETSAEVSAYADYTQPLSSAFSLGAGLRCSMFASHGDVYKAADPDVSVSYATDRLGLKLSYALRHQYLFLLGFSGLGLPSDFYLPSSSTASPQYAHCVNLGVTYTLPGNNYSVTVDAFYRRLYRQMEFGGSFLDFYNSDFSIEKSCMFGDGENKGFSVLLNKCTGRFTGWISYMFTHARRTFPALSTQKSYPADHERPHELNAVVSYSIGKHWNVGGTYVFASGTPFTSPVCLMVINGNIMAQYGEHNANRLRPYSRLDLSANYKWTVRRGVTHGVNLSLYNATCARNHLYYRVKTQRDGKFLYRPVSFVAKVLPSVSYFCKF